MKNSGYSSSFISLLLVAACSAANAAEVIWDPAISSKVEYNDNLNMSANDKTNVSAVSVIPALDFWYKEPTWKTKFGARVMNSDYNGTYDLDKTDSFFNALLDYQVTEKLTAALKGNYIQDTTLDSDFYITGLTFQRFRRESWDVAPSLSYYWSPSISTNIEYQHSDLDFKDNVDGQPLDPYNADSVNTQLLYTLTEKDQLFTGLSYLTYSTDTDPLVSTQIDVYQPSLNLGWSRQHDETLSYTLSAGARKTKTKLETPELFFGFFPTGNILTSTSEETGYTYAGSISKALEISNIEVSLSQNITPSSSSGLTETTNLTGRYDRQISEKFDTILKISYIDSQTVTGTSSLNINDQVNNTTLVINPEVRWHFEQDWYLAFAYRYTNQNDEASQVDATGNLGYLEIKYDWPKTSLSR